MKIAIATRQYATLAGHAGQVRHWLLIDCAEGAPVPDLARAERVELAADEVFHVFEDQRPHPLDGVELMLLGSAGDGFLRHMAKRGATVIVSGESDPAAALARVIAGEAQPDPRFDPTRILCRVRDLFSRH